MCEQINGKMNFRFGMRKTEQGWIGAAFSGRGPVCALLPRKSKTGAPARLRERIAPATLTQGPLKSSEDDFLEEYAAYFTGKIKRFSRKPDMILGSVFDQTVWKAAMSIPYGETRSYQWTAERAGRPGAARAVGGALGRNPLPIIVPCHRVIRSSGELGGFGSGIKWKRFLLELEKNPNSPEKRDIDIC